MRWDPLLTDMIGLGCGEPNCAIDMHTGIDPLDAAATKRSKVKVADLGGMLSRATLDGTEDADKSVVAAPVDELPAAAASDPAVVDGDAAAGSSVAVASSAGVRSGSPVRRKGIVACARWIVFVPVCDS